MSDATSDGEMKSAGSSRKRVYDTFLPLFLLALAITIWFCFQTVLLLKERENMRVTIDAQDKPIQEAKKVRDSLDVVARETALLADQGNQNAGLIVAELKKRGITINPNATPAPVPPAGK